MNKFLAAAAVAFSGLAVSVVARWPVLQVSVSVPAPPADVHVLVNGREVAQVRGCGEQTVRFRSPAWTPPTQCTLVIRRDGWVTHRIRSVPFMRTPSGWLATAREEMALQRRPAAGAPFAAPRENAASGGASPLPDILHQVNTLSDSQLRSAFARAQRYALERRAAGDKGAAHRADAVVRLLEAMFRHRRRAETVRLFSPSPVRPTSLFGPDWTGRRSEEDDVALP